MKLNFLELPTRERGLYIEQAATRLNRSPVVLEKDFWVCWMLGVLFKSEFAGNLVFKGGTSLSKVFGIIERFSEDIDLSLSPAFLKLPEAGKSRNQANKWMTRAETARDRMKFTPETVKLLTEDEINRHSKSAWEKLYQQVEELLKRFHPFQWSQLVAHQFRECRDNFRLFSTRPPHHLLRSIEANAAYWRKQNNDDPAPRFQRVMNAYIGHEDPLLLSLAAKDLIHMGLLMHREQIEIQVQTSNQELARLWLLFVQGNPTPKTTSAFVERFRITPAQWLQLCYVTYRVTLNDVNSRATVAQLAEYGKDQFGVKMIEWFVKKSSWTPEQFAENYRVARAKTPLQFHSFIRSGFLQSPIIDFGYGRWLAPYPPLIFQHMGTGLYRLFRDLWESSSNTDSETMRHEFACTTERHISRILACYGPAISISDEKKLLKHSSGKSCDFLMEAPDAIVLVESKGVTFDRNLLLPKFMQEDVTTARIIDAGEQLRQTYENLRAGRFDSFVTDRSKPVIAVIATYGDIPYVNSDWYFEKVIAPRAETPGGSQVLPSFGLPSRPITMSHETLEMFIIALNTFNTTITEIVDEKKALPFPLSGDWNSYLRQKLKSVDIKRLPYIADAAEEFYRSLGISDENIQDQIQSAP